MAEIRDFASVTSTRNSKTEPHLVEIDSPMKRASAFASWAAAMSRYRTDRFARAAETRRAHRRNPDRTWLLALRNRGAARRRWSERAVERTIASGPRCRRPTRRIPAIQFIPAMARATMAFARRWSVVRPSWCAAAIHRFRRHRMARARLGRRGIPATGVPERSSDRRDRT